MSTTFLRRVKQTASDLQPYAEDVLHEIAEAAETLGQTTKESRATQNVMSRVSSARPSRDQIIRRPRSDGDRSDHQSKLIEKTRESVTKAADSISDSVDVKHLASELAHGIVQIQNEAKKLDHRPRERRFSSVTEHARASTARKKDESIAATKDFAGFIGWSGVAGVIIYKSLLDAGRQQAARRVLGKGLSTGRALIRRARGESS